MDAIVKFELTKEFLERFSEALQARNDAFIRSSLEGVNPADISSILEEFSAEECKYIFELLPVEIDSEILNELNEDVLEDFLVHFSSKEIAQYVELMDSDDAADVLYQMPPKQREEVIGFLENEDRAQNILDLLQYEEDVAGGLMAKELVKANENWTVKECIDEIRMQAENVEKIYSVYVVDDHEKLLGKVDLKKIILSNDSVRVADIFDDDLVSVETYLEGVEVANLMQKYDFDAVPVVNARHKLVGRITIDDIVDVITETADEERQLMTGVSSDVEEDDTVWAISRARLPWLIIGMAGGVLGAQFMGLFREDIILIPAVAFFIPLITATGGNVGIQSSSIVVQTLASSNIFIDTMGKRLLKVFLVAIVNGVILSLMVFGLIIFINKDQALAMTVSLALLSVVLLASFMGTVTPLVLNRLGVNPALASGPFITTTNDLLGLAVYFSVAHVLYNL
ncbi:MAG: magnesium transporter [Cytophagales bacterium]|nr:magnesium transporter [Cytophagales bacterium]